MRRQPHPHSPPLLHRMMPRRAPSSPRRARGGSALEYIAVLALVVIPLALLSPMLLKMIVTYSHRIAVVIRLPLGEAPF